MNVSDYLVHRLNRTAWLLGLAAATGASLASLVSPALGDPATVARQGLSLEGARRVALAAAGEAARLNAGGSIAVVDEGGALIFLERLDNTFPASATVAIEKARTAAQFRRPTSAFEDAIKNGRLALTAVPVMLPLEGGVPILVDGQVVGAVGVSGAATADQDNDIAKLAALALTPAPTPLASGGK